MLRRHSFHHSSSSAFPFSASPASIGSPRLSSWLCVLFVCIFVSLPRSASQSCDPCVSGGGSCNGLDLTSVGSQDFSASSKSHNYDIQLCQDIMPCGGRACKKEWGQPDDNLGTSPQWTLKSAGDISQGVSFVTTQPGNDGMDDCEGNTQSTVNVVCGSRGDDSASVDQEGSGGSCQWTFTIDSKYICSLPKGGGGGGGGGGGSTDSAKSGLSGGSIFVILFFVTAFVYFVGGILFNKYRRGLSGSELIPNIAFWRDLPGLVKDGCVFTFQKVRALCGGGRSGSLLSKGTGSTYETI